jgi:hypothetical protein
MIRTPCLLLVAALALGGEPAASIPAAYAAYTTTAGTLAPAGTSRPAAVIALHAFVRDRIAETPTKWA